MSGGDVPFLILIVLLSMALGVACTYCFRHYAASRNRPIGELSNVFIDERAVTSTPIHPTMPVLTQPAIHMTQPFVTTPTQLPVPSTSTVAPPGAVVSEGNSSTC